MILRFRKIFLAGILVLIALPLMTAKAFHQNIYQPRAPESFLEELQDMDNPFPPTPENNSTTD